MHILVDQKVIAGSLADDLEIVHEGIRRADLEMERPLGLTCGLILVAGGQTRAAHSLRLEVILSQEPALGVGDGDEQDMQSPRQLDEFARPPMAQGTNTKRSSGC